MWTRSHDMYNFCERVTESQILYHAHMISYSCRCLHDSLRYISCLHDLTILTKTWFQVDIHFFYIMYHITWFDNQNMILVPGSHELYHVHMISYSCTCQHDSFRYILCVHHCSILTWTLFQVDMNFCSMWIKSCIMC